MTLADAYGPGRCALSFELFPPQTEAGERALWRQVAQLIELRPSFITCTYGAGGSTRDKTLQIVQQVRQQFQLPVAAHLTCVGASVDQLREFLVEAARGQIDAIVALRGDPPRGESEFRPTPGGLQYANQLVELIRREFPQFGVAVAGYPETHQEAPSPEADLANLRRKVDAGADVVITQLFFNNADFFSFRDRCRQAGISVPIVPGILPVINLAQIKRISSLCGAQLPQSFVAELSRHDDPQWQQQVGVEFAQRQVAELCQAGVPGLHFYVLNKAQATAAVLSAVDM